jgi:hypothetical protein
MQVQTLCLNRKSERIPVACRRSRFIGVAGFFNHLSIRYLDLFRILIFGFRIYHTLNVHNINPYRVESVPGLLGSGIYECGISLCYVSKMLVNRRVGADFKIASIGGL